MDDDDDKMAGADAGDDMAGDAGDDMAGDGDDLAGDDDAGGGDMAGDDADDMAGDDWNADGEPNDAPPTFDDLDDQAIDADAYEQPPATDERPPVAPPTFQISPSGAGHECVVAMPTNDGRTIKATGRGKSAADAASAALRLASKAVSSKKLLVLLPPQARIMVAAASGLAKLYKSNPKAVKAAGRALKGGLRKLASVFS